jgi:hypothetical protein
MGKKKEPPAPTPQSSYTYQDGVLTGQNVFDAGRQAYINSTFSSPAQKAFQDMGNQQMPQLLGKLQQAYNPSEAEQQQYFNDYVDPQLRDINKSFDQQTASANQGAIASGIGNSAGFSRFLANDVMGERAKQTADVNRQGRLAQYDLGALRARQYMPLLDLLTGRQDTGLQQANQMGQLNAGYGGNLNNVLNSQWQTKINDARAGSNATKAMWGQIISGVAAAAGQAAGAAGGGG